jgi:hypothetical protein
MVTTFVLISVIMINSNQVNIINKYNTLKDCNKALINHNPEVKPDILVCTSVPLSLYEKIIKSQKEMEYVRRKRS